MLPSVRRFCVRVRRRDYRPSFVAFASAVWLCFTWSAICQWVRRGPCLPCASGLCASLAWNIGSFLVATDLYMVSSGRSTAHMDVLLIRDTNRMHEAACCRLQIWQSRGLREFCAHWSAVVAVVRDKDGGQHTPIVFSIVVVIVVLVVFG
jgi:hypothetical protein